MDRQPYQRYEESYKLEVVRYYYDNGEDRKKTIEQFGIDHSCLRDWLRRYTQREKVVSLLKQIQEDMAKAYRKLPQDLQAAQVEYERIQKELEAEKLKNTALSTMIDIAERELNVPIRKKSAPNGECAPHDVSVTIDGDIVRTVWQDTTSVLQVAPIRLQRMRYGRDYYRGGQANTRDCAGIGSSTLFPLLSNIFGRDNMIGRDRFYALMKERGLQLKRRRSYRTTNSFHHFHKWKNLIKNLVIDGPNQLWVSDITYIKLTRGVVYLHLVTDAFSRKVLGWKVADSLEARHTLDAFNMAAREAAQMGVDFTRTDTS